MSSEIRAGDVGTKLLITVIDSGSIVDISLASSKEIRIKKPDGTVISRPATFETDGTDGKLYYIVVVGDLAEAGLYKMQGKVVLPTGSFRTSIATFNVHCNL